MKKEKENNKPELNIESMATKSEIIKALMAEPNSSITFETLASNDKVDAAITVTTPDSKVQRKWSVASTNKFALKLIALLDNQEELTDNITAALAETEKDFMATREFVRKEWDVR